MLINDLNIKIYRINIMKNISGKAALLALGMISTSAFASHWSYQAEGAPEHWGELDEAYKICKSGMNQSPVNIDTTVKAHLSPLETHYIDGPVTLTNNGHTIQARERRIHATASRLITKTGRYSSSISMRQAKIRCTVKNTQWKCIWSTKMPTAN